jgi:hypothetical protein
MNFAAFKFSNRNQQAPIDMSSRSSSCDSPRRPVRHSACPGAPKKAPRRLYHAPGPATTAAHQQLQQQLTDEGFVDKLEKKQ